MKYTNLRKIIREEIESVMNDTNLGEFGTVITSPEELIEGESYNVYDPQLSEWFFDYVYGGYDPYSKEFYFNPQDEYDLDKPTYSLSPGHLNNYIKNSWVLKI